MLQDELPSILVDDDIKQLIIVDSAEQRGLHESYDRKTARFL